MNNKKTPVSSVIFYIIGIILLIVSLFMLWTAVNYTKTYLQSYDASFSDMWSNSVQYIIAQFVPYLGMGVICLGLGRAIAGSAAAKAAGAAVKAAEEQPQEAAEAETAEEAAAEAAPEMEAEAAPVQAAVSDGQIADLIRRIDTNREVLSIKIEEKEKRDSYRIRELEKKVEGFLDDFMYINEPIEKLVFKQAGVYDEDIAPEEVKEVGPTPQIFRVTRNMTAPACPTVKPAAGPTPQIFRVARNMTAPACPAVKAAEAAPAAGPTPQIFRVARNMTAPACPAVKAAGDVKAAGPVPPVFRVARTMTMTV